MKKFLILFAMVLPMLFVGCSSDDEKDDGGSGSSENIVVSLQVTGLADNQATINISLSEGKFYGAMMIEAMSSDEVTIDPSDDIDLVNFVRENGVDVNLPYTNTLTGLRAGAEFFTAVIAFNDQGRAVSTAYSIWTVEGTPDGWSTDNSAGELGKEQW